MTNGEETPTIYPVSTEQQAEIKPLVSAIVPVYNVEPYLRRCIDSLINQTLQDIEIILVNDGSTDGGGRICDEYASKDARIRVVHQENAGLSEARNAGIDCARANYLMFVDSDDWVEPDFCRIPLTIAKDKQADLVVFLFHCFQKGREKKRLFYPIDEGIKTQVEALDLIQSNVGMAAWNKLYHRDLFRRNRYPKGKNFEDVFLTPILVHEAKRIVYTPIVLYNYEKRIGSITTDPSTKNAWDQFNAITATAQHLTEWGYPALSE
jgi:Glycosyltransferases involved in cell wall biogenesis